MSPLDYSYTFSDITERFCQVKIIDHNKGQAKGPIQVAIRDNSLLANANKRVPSLIADLMDVAIAISLADRMSIRRYDMPCRIKVDLPVRQLEILSRPDIQERFQDILYWFTGDVWSINFTKHLGHNRISEMQLSFIEGDEYLTTVALWSGGLDALAGVYYQLSLNSTDHYTLFSTGSNFMIHKVQRDVASVIKDMFPNRTQLIQIPFLLSKTRFYAKDSDLRTRGFVFILLGSACAYLLGQSSLDVYENGVGAINLPFTRAEVGLDHSRSVHPLSLYNMSELLSKLFERPFSIHNPFLFKTKAQMCGSLSLNGATDLIFRTVSCDRRHRKKPSQCGYCSSCLLRRQALAAQGIIDKTKYVITSPSSGRRKSPEDSLPLRAMLSQVEDLRILLNQADPWQSLSDSYSWLREIIDRTCEKEGLTRQEMSMQLIHMYKSYVSEWDVAKHFIEPGLLSYEETVAG